MNRTIAILLLASACAFANEMDRQPTAVAVQTITAINTSGTAVANENAAGAWKERVKRAADLDRQGRFTEATPLYSALIAEVEKLPPNDPRRSETLNNAATHAYYSGEYARAALLYEGALRAFESAAENDNAKLAAIYANTAVIHRVLAEYANAEDAAFRATQLNPGSANSWNTAAEVYRVEGKLQDAERAARKALALANPVERDAKTHLLAGILSDLGEYGEALALYSRAVESQLRVSSVTAATTLANMGVLHIRRGDYENAEAALNRALEMWDSAGVRASMQVAGAINNLAQVRKLQGRYVEAEPLYRKALAAWEACVGRQHPEYAKGLSNLADLYHVIGNDRAAEQTYGKAAEILSATLGNQSAPAMSIRNRRIEILNALGRYTDAKRVANSLK